MGWKNYRGFILKMGWAVWDVMGLSRRAGREGHAEQGTWHQQGHIGESEEGLWRTLGEDHLVK